MAEKFRQWNFASILIRAQFLWVRLATACRFSGCARNLVAVFHDTLLEHVRDDALSLCFPLKALPERVDLALAFEPLVQCMLQWHSRHYHDDAGLRIDVVAHVLDFLELLKNVIGVGCGGDKIQLSPFFESFNYSGMTAKCNKYVAQTVIPIALDTHFKFLGGAN